MPAGSAPVPRRRGLLALLAVSGTLLMHGFDPLLAASPAAPAVHAEAGVDHGSSCVPLLGGVAAGPIPGVPASTPVVLGVLDPGGAPVPGPGIAALCRWRI